MTIRRKVIALQKIRSLRLAGPGARPARAVELFLTDPRIRRPDTEGLVAATTPLCSLPFNGGHVATV
jgi:hypothetical protein